MATPVPLDSLEGASSADSVLVTTELARLASALPESNDAVFRGLPFNVKKAYRTKGGPIGLLIGDVVRKINEEANPREEHFLIVAERSSGADGRYTTVFHSRAAGSEEVVRTNEILAVVRFVNGGNTAVIVSFEYENGGRLAFIEQTSEKVWKTSWRSAYTRLLSPFQSFSCHLPRLAGAVTLPAIPARPSNVSTYGRARKAWYGKGHPTA